MSARHAIHIPDLPPRDVDEVTIDGDEARHALRVKRLRVGDAVDLLDGRGVRAAAEVVDDARKSLRLRILSRQTIPAQTPRLEVWSPAPKGDRLERMIDGLSQVGAASWVRLACQRAVVEPRDAKIERLQRVAIESMKQCRRAHLLKIDGPASIADAFETAADVLLADASGDAYAPRTADVVRLLVGPEGGFTPDEIAEAEARGARRIRFGRHTMRIETAAVAGASVVIANA